MQENELVKATIDYLKVTFYFDEFDITNLSELDLELLRIMKLDPIMFEEEHRVRGYNKTYRYDEDVLIGVDPQNKGVVEEYVEHFCLELSGTPLHQLEEKGMNLLELLTFCESVPHKVNRIDIAIDDFGIMNLETLKNKISNDVYVSGFRALFKGGKRSTEQIESNYDEILQDAVEVLGYRPRVIDSRKGYSATWGSKLNGATELQFYDKAAERKAHSSPVSLKQWNRFEMRFGRLGNRGNQVLKRSIEAINKNSFGILARSLLSGLIEFKEIPENKSLENLKKNNHMRDCPIWRDYRKFLSGAEKIEIPYEQGALEKSVERSLSWVQSDWNSTIIKFAMTGDYHMDKSGIAKYIAKHGISFKMIAQARNYVIKTQNKVLSDEEILDNFEIFINSYIDPSDIDEYEIDIKAMYKRKKERNQMMMTSQDKFFDNILNGDEKDE